MAEYVVSLVIESIAGQMVDEAVSLARVRDQVEWIQGELRRMLCFLKDADAKQDGDERVRNWVADIREVAYDAEDVIDGYILKMMQQKEKALIRLFNRYPFFLNELVARYKLNKQITRIKLKIHDISNGRSTYGIENIGERVEGASFAVNSLRERRRSYPHSSEEETVGTDEDIKILEDQLINGDLRLSIISIIGMAGLGKTTLAKKIYGSSSINKYFDCRAWIYVSQEYKAGDILRDLCKKVMGFRKAELERMHREEMEEELSSVLEQRRFIVVLDDIWNKEAWDDLKPVFPDTKNGSRIIFTTRFRDVALHADPRSRPHEPCLLSDEDSWKLLSKKICLEWNAMTSLPAWTEELGIQIVKKCRGLPLAIVVLGGLLSRREATYEEWLKVLQSAHWQLLRDPTQCLDILALSYHDLPYYLKPCFLYFGLFPEDFEISVRSLNLLWVAEGFVQPRGQEPLEDVAEDYLEELVGRSMVQIAAKKFNGRIKTIRIHDLFRELAIKKAKEDRFFDIIHGDAKDCFLTRPRRISTSFGITPKTTNRSRIRSLLVFDQNEPRLKDLKKFKLLRVLGLESVHIGLLDSDVGNLIHLRYLGLEGTWLKQLPSSICRLLNLQTLDLRSTLIDPIPVSIWKLPELRHLFFNKIREMVVKPPKDVCLFSLQTLQGVCIGRTSSVELGLDKLTTLRHLSLFGHLNLQEEALRRWIFNSKGLQSLKLDSRTRGEDITRVTIPGFLDFSSHISLNKLYLGGFMLKLLNVQDFPPNLTELTLHGSFLMEDPMKTLEKLPSLRVLKLKHSAYVGKRMVCSSGGFPQLQFLKLSFLYSVGGWRIQEGAMAKLKELHIVECKRLRIVPRGLWPVTTLSNLKLGYMPSDFEMKARDRKGENWYRIEHVLPV
ncbi:putative disease resistance protein At1g50180 [Herrania umbratica]|uniref:Disease resistance protein At1g50180 n=1 Tax=Herrania umbratica TaxID=108875 RepID=A0A6J1AIY1_9ROSI|nr:putative disease resistance protein At1g50180 [Herrania umbratica]